MSTIMGEDWVWMKIDFFKNGWKTYGAIYNQNGFVLESLGRQILTTNESQKVFR